MGQEAIVEALPSWIGFLGGPMLPAKTEWETGLSADAVLRDQCLSVGLQEPFPSRQEREGRKKTKKNRGRVKGVVAQQG